MTLRSFLEKTMTAAGALALVDGGSSVETMGEYLSKAAGDGFGYAYVTERPSRDPSGKYCKECLAVKDVTPACEEDCNPWNRLATYWQKEVESVLSGGKSTLTRAAI
jgi:hypothetical protein